MATIVQNYGPIYGEVVNGTVQGRPNGSVYVPLSNRISLTVTGAGTIYNSGRWGRIHNWTISVAESQDLANYIQRQVYSDAECTTLVGASNFNPGLFNRETDWWVYFDNENTLEIGETYYIRAQLMSSGGDPVATSDVIAVECVST